MVARNPLTARQRSRAARKLELSRELPRFESAVGQMREAALDAIEALQAARFDPYKASRTYDRFHDPDLIQRTVKNPVRCPRGMRVQSLIFDRRHWTKLQARAWAKRHGFRSSGLEATAESWRIRQVEPARFAKGSFRVIVLAAGVRAIIGCPRSRSKR